MNETLKRRIALGALAWFCALAGARGADVRGYGVFKTQDYLQTSTNAPILQTNWPPYSFSAIAQPQGLFSNQVTSASVESPPSGFTDQLTPPSANSDQPFASYFDALSQAVVDAKYPTGVYILRINTAHDGNKALLLNLTTNRFPTNAPRVANFNEAQSVDASTNFVVRWDAFGGGTSNDFVSFSVADANGAVVFRSATFGPEPGLALLNGTNTSILIASNKLSAGQTYFGYLIFERDVVIQTNDYAGATGLVGFAAATSFTLKTKSVAPIAPPTLEILAFAANQLVVRLHGDPGRSYVILSSTNLAGPNWTPITTNVAVGGSFNFTNAVTGSPNQRFYRALFKP